MQAHRALLAFVSLTAGCAAMQRTWQFHATPVATSPVRVELADAQITQKTAFVTLGVTNVSSAPITLEAKTFELTLPDGAMFVGKTSFLGRKLKEAKGMLASIGMMDEEEAPKLEPDATVSIKLAFRQYGRDFRRHPKLRVDLAALQVDGKPLPNAVLVLEAPPEAPMGENI